MLFTALPLCFAFSQLLTFTVKASTCIQHMTVHYSEYRLSTFRSALWYFTADSHHTPSHSVTVLKHVGTLACGRSRLNVCVCVKVLAIHCKFPEVTFRKVFTASGRWTLLRGLLRGLLRVAEVNFSMFQNEHIDCSVYLAVRYCLCL